ncbi:flagellar assembly protein FliW [Clostridium sp. MSJ-4]|uniref:Flagellar assembly factor FliW n=1 Tax=Clostridium simiarum TaxID=2841506 RepID=A0ABS6EYN6_9CLOT|nr:flagellar assembly protein FliW [Clostridium simiarum]MBU5591108.1 flagellar assembly protein FliW [Clostridium simiarum]
MNFETKHHGTIEFEEKDVIEFKKGLPGFESLKKFILISLENNTFLKVLHSIEDKDIGLMVVSPFDFLKDYEVSIEEEVLENLSIDEEKDVVVLNTVTLSSEINKITTNLRAPIIINIKKALGEQIIIQDEKYPIKYPLIKE